jgi:hypothetical protein
VTTYTDHGLACLSDTDYAAIALAMQVDALATDAALDAISDALGTHYTNPYMVARTTANAGPFTTTAAEPEITIPNWTVTSSNMTTASATSGVRVTIPRAGWYAHGCYMNLVASAGITALSRRTSIARATLIAPGTAIVLSEVFWRTVETSTGGEFLVSSGGMFYAAANTTVNILALLTHGNLASGINVIAPARIWCHFVGSGVEIGSA